MKITVSVTKEELDEMELSADSLEETLYHRIDNSDFDELEGFDIYISVIDNQ